MLDPPGNGMQALIGITEDVKDGHRIKTTVRFRDG
jgi:hypothetical protein